MSISNLHRNNESFSGLAAAYIRRSSAKQEGNQSFEIQKQAIKNFAEHKGYQLIDEFIFIDEATSAFKKSVTKRVGMQQMKEAVLTKEINAVIFYDFSRIDRKIYSFVTDFYRDVIQEKPNLKFFTTTKADEWSPDDLEVKLHLIIANAESKEKSRRAVDAQCRDLEVEHFRPGASVPYGYNQVNKRLVPNQYASNVLFIFYLSSWGYSMQKIAEILNGAAIVSPTKKKWKSSAVENILKNQVYLGSLSWEFSQSQKKKQQYHFPNLHEPIVPKMLYQLVKSVQKVKKVHRKLDTPFLLSGLLRCGHCQELIKHRNASTKKNNHTYSYMKYYCDLCKYEFEINRLHDDVMSYMNQQWSISLKINRESVRLKIEQCKLAIQEMLSNKKNELTSVQNNLSNCPEELNSEMQRIYSNVIKKLSTEITQLEKQLDKYSSLQSPEELRVFTNNFESLMVLQLSLQEKRLLVLWFLDEIVITLKDSKKEIYSFDLTFKANPIIQAVI